MGSGSGDRDHHLQESAPGRWTVSASQSSNASSLSARRLLTSGEVNGLEDATTVVVSFADAEVVCRPEGAYDRRAGP